MPKEPPPFIYELHCFCSPDEMGKIFQGWADTKDEAIALGQRTLDVGHPDPSVIETWKARGVVGDDYASPWGRIVVYWAQYNPANEYQDISDGKPVADLRSQEAV